MEIDTKRYSDGENRKEIKKDIQGVPNSMVIEFGTVGSHGILRFLFYHSYKK